MRLFQNNSQGGHFVQERFPDPWLVRARSQAYRITNGQMWLLLPPAFERQARVMLDLSQGAPESKVASLNPIDARNVG